MQLFIKNLANLIKLKTLMSLLVISVTSYGFVVGKVSSELYIAITMAIITYYFTKQEPPAMV